MQPRRLLLGTIVEVGLDAGLDVIAAFKDGRVRYINHTGKLAIFEAASSEVAAPAEHLIAVSQPIVDRIGPSEQPRRPPPPKGSVRMTTDLRNQHPGCPESRFGQLLSASFGGKHENQGGPPLVLTMWIFSTT